MKDLKVIQDNLMTPYKPGDAGEPSILVVRNNDVNGRRLGVFTRFNTAVAGQRLNHADALLEPKTVTTVPQGYTSGVEVNLSAKRNYFLFGTYYITEQYAPPEDEMDWFAADIEMVNGGLKIGASAPDLTKLRTNLKTGDMSVSEATVDKSKNTFCSFTLVFAGTPYHVGLDLAKHPAHVTADLNARLNRIHPQLRGYVRADYSVPGLTPLEFYISPPESLDVTIPLTTFPTKNDLSPAHNELGVKPVAGTFHLNKALTSALLIDNTNGIRNTTNTVATVDNAAVKKNVDQLINEAFAVNLNAFTHEVATPTLYKGRVTIPATAFKSWDVDERVNFAMLKLRRQYEDGRVFRLLSVRYVNSDGSATAYADQRADLFLLRAPNDADGATTAFPSVYLNDLASADADQLEGYRYPTADAIKFAEAGELNEESAMYVGLFSTPTLDNRNSIFFRNTVTATYLEIEYELVEADVIPTVKIDDLGTLDYHYIKTEEHAFRPVAFSTTPVHKWNIEFITEGQEQRYQGINHGAVEGSDDIHMTTQGTVGEAVILAGIDYSKVKAPTTGEPLYFYTGEIGAETWLYQNLPYINVVTTREVTAVKSKYKVIFPDVAMTGTLVNIEEPLIAKQSDGSLVISGRFSNEAYPKNVFTHSTATTWNFSLKGATLNPTEAIAFDPLTGEFSARFAVNDLVEPGPGTHVFRVTATAKYPWLVGVSQYSETMDILVLPAVEGIEDDVTFIGSNLFDKNVDGNESSAYRLVDLDSGEILATGENPFALRQDAITRGLVDIDLIFGQLYEEEPEISCEGAPTNVDLEIDGEWDLEIDGVIVGSGTMEELKPTAFDHDVQITTPAPEEYNYYLNYEELDIIRNPNPDDVIIMINGAAVDLSSVDSSNYESTLKQNGLVINEQLVAADPYDPYGAYGGISYNRMLNITNQPMTIEFIPTNRDKVDEFMEFGGVSGQVSKSVDAIIVKLGSYIPEIRADVKLVPTARLFGVDGIGANDPSVKFTVGYIDKYLDAPVVIDDDFYFNGVAYAYEENGEYPLPDKEMMEESSGVYLEFKPSIYLPNLDIEPSDISYKVYPFIPLGSLEIQHGNGTTYTAEYDFPTENEVGGYYLTIQNPEITDGGFYLKFPAILTEHYFAPRGVSPTLLSSYENNTGWVYMDRLPVTISQRNEWTGFPLMVINVN